jgi:hypothetical protein
MRYARIRPRNIGLSVPIKSAIALVIEGKKTQIVTPMMVIAKTAHT